MSSDLETEEWKMNWMVAVVAQLRFAKDSSITTTLDGCYTSVHEFSS
jgi:hypothetical protein